jgi:cathepsin A (carboxypeptidase C)
MFTPVNSDWCPSVLRKAQSTTEEAAVDIAAFISIFFEHFSQFKGRPFHISGESYGVCWICFIERSEELTLLKQGRYVPVFAAAVYDQNKALEKAGLTPINLVSVMIGMSTGECLASAVC